MPLLQAVDRLNEKRSWFGSIALETIDKFFNQAEFKNKPEAIKTYALWATRGDGPGLYATPTPIHVTVLAQDPAYIVCCLLLRVTSNVIRLTLLQQKPSGIFKSQFVVSIMSAFLRSIKASRHSDPGFPDGALGMTAMAVSASESIFFRQFIVQHFILLIIASD